MRRTSAQHLPMQSIRTQLFNFAGASIVFTLVLCSVHPASAASFTTVGSLNIGRSGHTATLLPNGKVLVAGGENDVDLIAEAEIYDPATGTWRFTGPMNLARTFHTATLLPNGKVLVAGGNNYGSLTNAELYDPASETWTITGSMNV